MATAVIGGAAIIGGALISSSGAKSAARTASKGQEQAAVIQKESADRARQDVLSILNPAMKDYVNQLSKSRDALIRGETDVISILNNTTANADSLLQQSGADAQKLIMGAQAYSRGVPRQDFEQQYTQSTGTPGSIQQVLQPSTLSDVYSAPSTTPSIPSTKSLGMFGLGANLIGKTKSAIESLATKSGIKQPPTPTMGGTQLPGVSTYVPGRSDVQAVPGTGYIQARTDLEGSRDISRSDITQGMVGALDELGAATRSGLAQTAEYSKYGKDAAYQEAALSGALGPEAQQEAINAFIESPGQKYLREQQEQALLRNAAATGGTGGGRILQALQEQAFGLAATNQQQQLANLGTIAARGAGISAGDQSFIGSMGAQRAGTITGASQNLAQIESLYGPQMANLAMQTGLQLADIQNMTDRQRADLLLQTGTAIANTRGGTLADIAAMEERIGTTGLNLAQQKAATLANIGTTSGTNIANLAAGSAQSTAAGQMAASQAWSQGLSGLGQIAAYGLSNYGGSNPTVIPQTMNPNIQPSMFGYPNT